MKIRIPLILLLLFSSCNNNSEKIINIDDTVFFRKTHSENYQKYRNDTYLRQYKNAYNAMLKTELNKDFFNRIEGEPYFTNVLWFITGFYYNEELIYDAVIIFYLRSYLADLENNNYVQKYFSDIGENPYTPVFFLIFLKISNHNPEKGILLNTVYEWIKKHPDYIDNKDIKKIIDSIDQKLVFKKSNNKIFIKN